MRTIDRLRKSESGDFESSPGYMFNNDSYSNRALFKVLKDVLHRRKKSKATVSIKH